MKMREIASYVAKAEGGKSQAKMGDIFQGLKKLTFLMATSPAATATLLRDGEKQVQEYARKAARKKKLR